MEKYQMKTGYKKFILFIKRGFFVAMSYLTVTDHLNLLLKYIQYRKCGH